MQVIENTTFIANYFHKATSLDYFLEETIKKSWEIQKFAKILF